MKSSIALDSTYLRAASRTHELDGMKDEARTVSGTVTYSDGVPAKDVCVEAFDQDLRCRQGLGTAITDHLGQYEIRYKLGQCVRAEKAGADLVMKVVEVVEGADGEETEKVLFETAFEYVSCLISPNHSAILLFPPFTRISTSQP